MLGRHLLAAALLSLLIPGVGLFCWHVLVATDQETPRQSGESSGIRPADRLLQKGAEYAGQFRPLPGSLYYDLRNSNPDDPLQTGVNREMMSAQGDPFLFAFLNGTPEGSLFLKGLSAGIPTLGVQFPRASLSQLSRKDLLNSIEQGLGGSLKNFLGNVLGAQHLDALEFAQDDAFIDENPFSRAIEAMKGSLIAERAFPLVEAKPEKPASKEQTPPAGSKDPAPAKQALGGGGSVNTVRPYFMLKVEPDGSLRATAMSQPRAGTFESAEFGLREYNIFPLHGPANVPLSIAVADFNGDHYADLVLHVPQQGLLRFFFGTPEGNFIEGLKVQAGRAQSSLAAGDFNGDGWMDLAVSDLGTGALVFLYGDPNGPCRHYKYYWVDIYRDYITTTYKSDFGIPALLGMNYSGQATELMDFSQPEGKISGQKTPFLTAFNSDVPLGSSRSGKLNSVVISANLSVNLENWEGRLLNVVNVRAGTKIEILVGDFDNNGAIDVGLATPIR